MSTVISRAHEAPPSGPKLIHKPMRPSSTGASGAKPGSGWYTLWRGELESTPGRISFKCQQLPPRPSASFQDRLSHPSTSQPNPTASSPKPLTPTSGHHHQQPKTELLEPFVLTPPTTTPPAEHKRDPTEPSHPNVIRHSPTSKRPAFNSVPFPPQTIHSVLARIHKTSSLVLSSSVPNSTVALSSCLGLPHPDEVLSSPYSVRLMSAPTNDRSNTAPSNPLKALQTRLLPVDGTGTGSTGKALDPIHKRTYRGVVIQVPGRKEQIVVYGIRGKNIQQQSALLLFASLFNPGPGACFQPESSLPTTTDSKPVLLKFKIPSLPSHLPLDPSASTSRITASHTASKSSLSACAIAPLNRKFNIPSFSRTRHRYGTPVSSDDPLSDTDSSFPAPEPTPKRLKDLLAARPTPSPSTLPAYSSSQSSKSMARASATSKSGRPTKLHHTVATSGLVSGSLKGAGGGGGAVKGKLSAGSTKKRTREKSPADGETELEVGLPGESVDEARWPEKDREEKREGHILESPKKKRNLGGDRAGSLMRGGKIGGGGSIFAAEVAADAEGVKRTRAASVCSSVSGSVFERRTEEGNEFEQTNKIMIRRLAISTLVDLHLPVEHPEHQTVWKWVVRGAGFALREVVSTRILPEFEIRAAIEIHARAYLPSSVTAKLASLPPSTEPFDASTGPSQPSPPVRSTSTVPIESCEIRSNTPPFHTPTTVLVEPSPPPATHHDKLAPSFLLSPQEQANDLRIPVISPSTPDKPLETASADVPPPAFKSLHQQQPDVDMMQTPLHTPPMTQISLPASQQQLQSSSPLTSTPGCSSPEPPPQISLPLPSSPPCASAPLPPPNPSLTIDEILKLSPRSVAPTFEPSPPSLPPTPEPQSPTITTTTGTPSSTRTHSLPPTTSSVPTQEQEQDQQHEEEAADREKRQLLERLTQEAMAATSEVSDEEEDVLTRSEMHPSTPARPIDAAIATIDAPSPSRGQEDAELTVDEGDDAGSDADEDQEGGWRYEGRRGDWGRPLLSGIAAFMSAFDS